METGKSLFLNMVWPRCPTQSTVGDPLETTRLDYVIQLADKQAELHVSNIDAYEPGTHALSGPYP